MSASSDGRASYGSLLGNLRAHVRSYVAKQLLLPRQELRELLAANLAATKWIGAGLLFVFLLLIAFVVLVVALIAIVLPLWASAVLTVVLFAAIAALLLYAGSRKLVLRGPERTIRSLKETVSWVKATLLGRSES